MAFSPLQIGDLTLQKPIIQGGMGIGVSLSGLASAVARSGGVGVVAGAGVGTSEPDYGRNPEEANLRAMEREIRTAKEKSEGGVVGVNIMVALTDYAQLVHTAAKAGVDMIIAGAGLPVDLPGLLPEKARTKLLPIVSSERAARILCKKWFGKFKRYPDGFVVEGPMAGGHLGFKAEELDNPDNKLEAILERVLEMVRPFEKEAGRPIPVFAAGGVYSGADIHKFLNLGAAGVQMGTRFVATHECDADDAFKQSYVRATKDDVTVIKSPVGLPGRALRNEFLDKIATQRGIKSCPFHCIKTCDYTTTPYCITAALVNAKKGRLTHGFAFAGQNAWRVEEIVSVAELMHSLEREYDASTALGRLRACMDPDALSETLAGLAAAVKNSRLGQISSGFAVSWESTPMAQRIAKVREYLDTIEFEYDAAKLIAKLKSKVDLDGVAEVIAALLSPKAGAR